MKKLALGLAIGATLVASAASAKDQRPAYLAFSRTAATADANGVSMVPAAPKVAKRNGADGIPVIVPILAGVGLVGLVVALASGGDDGSPN